MKKKWIYLVLCSLALNSIIFGQCSALFSFSGYFETVAFSNQSNVPNAHYFWNFGDGTGSNYKSPIHKFPETGNYLTTLFVKDTITNCSSYYEYWINATKFSSDSCQPGVITDSMFVYNNKSYLQISENSTNCNKYTKLLDGGGSQTFPPNWWLNLGNFSGRYIGRVRYVKLDPILNGYVTQRAVYKSCPYKYSSAKNYGNCSANFEFKVVSKSPSGQRILFTAMNRGASFYEWRIIGFGNPIISNNDTISQFYTSTWPHSELLWRVNLVTKDSSGCIDTLSQNIKTEEIGQTIVGINESQNPVINTNIYPNPTQGEFIISSSTEIEKVTLSDYLGNLLLQLDNPSLIHKMDIANFPAGIYFLTAENKRGQNVFKVIKE